MGLFKAVVKNLASCKNLASFSHHAKTFEKRAILGTMRDPTRPGRPGVGVTSVVI